jgi:16S rRNA (guanine966-N2)-methyltransferase
MKIISGQYKGRHFYMHASMRPTQDVARKALLDFLGHDMSDIAFLDLFAGSGAVGLEALSCGAKTVVAVEKESTVFNVLRDNLDLLHIPTAAQSGQRFEALAMDAFAAIKMLSEKGRKFDIVFADPPYEKDLGKKILKTVEAYDILQPTSIVVIQHQKSEHLPERLGRFLLFRSKKFGASVFDYYQIASDAE